MLRPGGDAVLPKCFHLAIIPLTANCGIFRREKLSAGFYTPAAVGLNETLEFKD